MVGLVVILAGVASILLGGVVTQRSLRRNVGAVTRENMMAAQLRGAVPSFAPFAVVGGLLAVIVGVVLVFVL